MASVAQVQSILQEVVAVTNEILTTIEGLDPALALPINVIQAVEGMVSVALTAYTTASGTPITVASVQALLPNPTPLKPPTS